MKMPLTQTQRALIEAAGYENGLSSFMMKKALQAQLGKDLMRSALKNMVNE